MMMLGGRRGDHHHHRDVALIITLAAGDRILKRREHLESPLIGIGICSGSRAKKGVLASNEGRERWREHLQGFHLGKRRLVVVVFTNSAVASSVRQSSSSLMIGRRSLGRPARGLL